MGRHGRAFVALLSSPSSPSPPSPPSPPLRHGLRWAPAAGSAGGGRPMFDGRGRRRSRSRSRSRVWPHAAWLGRRHVARKASRSTCGESRPGRGDRRRRCLGHPPAAPAHAIARGAAARRRRWSKASENISHAAGLSVRRAAERRVTAGSVRARARGWLPASPFSRGPASAAFAAFAAPRCRSPHARGNLGR